MLYFHIQEKIRQTQKRGAKKQEWEEVSRNLVTLKELFMGELEC